MAGSSFFKRVRKVGSLMALMIPALALTGCGNGDGPESIANTPATPLPPLPPGFCDPINFEIFCNEPGIINFNGGATIVIDNPDKSGINTSDKVARMQKFPDAVFGGTRLNLAGPVDFTQGRFYKIKIWSSRSVPVTFKLEQDGLQDGGTAQVIETHPGGSRWEELCFDFTAQNVTVAVPALTIIFDITELGFANTDPDNWTFYYDDITQAQSCGAGAGTPIEPDSALYSTGGDPDLVIPDDYSERTAFGSGSVIDPFFADDATYSPVLAVASGTGNGANIAQLGYIGFPAGFAVAYETLDFKVKGMPNFVIFVKLIDGVDALRVNLTSSALSGALGDGWYQVSIPISRFSGVGEATGIVFESDDTAPMQFTMLLTDIGFSGTGDSPPPDPVDPGLVPDDVIYATDPGETVDLVATITAFGTSSMFDGMYALDADFNPAFLAQSGSGYGLDNILQLGFVDLGAGFATAYETFSFKIKSDDLPNNTIIVKLEQGGAYGDVVLSDTNVSTPLGNGWYQVVLPMSGFSNVDPAVGILFEAVGPQNGAGGVPFSMLVTDIGFNNPAGGGGSGVVPEDVIYATDPGETVDLVATITAFGTSSMFDGMYALDADFNPAFLAQSGSGYGLDNILQLGFVDLGAGFASGYESFSFKIKSDDLPNNTIIVKLEQGGAYGDVVLSDTSVSTPLGNGWYQVVLPMSGFSNVDPAVGILFEAVGPQNGAGGVPFSMLVTDIGFSGTGGGGSGGGGGTAEGDISVNGGFETGNFDGWELFPNGGTQTITTSNPSSGTFAANLFVPVRSEGDAAVDNLIKNANLEAGNLTPGASVTVSFDMRGSLSGAGGVVFAEFFSELSGGGTSKAEIFTGGPLTLNENWTNYSFNTTLGPDVSGGVTLQLKTSCGPVVGCGVDAFFDNISIVLN